MDRRPIVQVIEFFHLAFLQVLPTRLDQAHYVLKGGANLRYFFESVRYSEDIDLDAEAIDAWRLEEKVDEVLASSAMRVLLRAEDLTLATAGKSKQTDTTQRWKPAIEGAGRDPVRTRIEFSHRFTNPRRILEQVPNRVVAMYALRPPTMLHYTADAAIEQKVEALAQRSETQARDVFDLDLLLRRHPGVIEPGKVPSGILLAAMDRTRELGFDVFSDQVLPFLDLEIAELYDRAAWEQMKEHVAETLAGLQ